MFKKIRQWLREYEKEHKTREMMQRVNRTIYIEDAVVNDCQAIALKINGVVVDYTFGNGKPTYDPDGISFNDDATRLLGKLLRLRVDELDRLRKGGAA